MEGGLIRWLETNIPYKAPLGGNEGGNGCKTLVNSDRLGAKSLLKYSCQAKQNRKFYECQNPQSSWPYLILWERKTFSDFVCQRVLLCVFMD